MDDPAQTGPRPAIRRLEDGLLVGFRVSPSATRTAIRGLYGDRIKVSLSAPPEDDRANTELVESLARWLGMRRDTIRIRSGRASRDKVVVFTGLDEAELQSRLAALLAGR
ncbi:MAG: DUF167 domain-containing protein [Thermoleophilia bacterium]|jgi:uncharacterized protein (TIGR00251 family)